MLRKIIFNKQLSFKEKALQIFDFQKECNPVYGKFCKALGISAVSQISEIPLLPIQAFKDARIISGINSASNIKELEFFQSSGTSGMSKSRHYITYPEIYEESVLKGMEYFYDLDEFVILAYTPGYNSNPHSSLIWMLKTLIKKDKTKLSQFLELGKPIEQKLLQQITSKDKRVMLFGAAFGLLDLIKFGKIELPKNSIIMETGGMKTHRREITRSKLHSKLAEGFNLSEENIHSEYGMTELLSQAYSLGDEWFRRVPWMNVSIRNPENPQEELQYEEEGLIGVIDLANLYSCSFILTGDKGIQKEDGTFQVLGRWNSMNLRGCNFLIDQD